MTTDTIQGHRPSSKSERNLIKLQVNINGIKNKLEELKLLIHDTHADIITIQETKLADRFHKAGGGLITLIGDNITFTTTVIPSDHIVCKITQINNIRRANTCDPALKLLNEEITSDIQKHKQNI